MHKAHGKKKRDFSAGLDQGLERAPRCMKRSNAVEQQAHFNPGASAARQRLDNGEANRVRMQDEARHMNALLCAIDRFDEAVVDIDAVEAERKSIPGLRPRQAVALQQLVGPGLARR